MHRRPAAVILQAAWWG